MKQKKKIIAVALLAVFSIAMLSMEVSAATTTTTGKVKKTTWKDYFSSAEKKVTENFASELVRDRLASGTGDWSGIISGKSLEKKSITSSKIKDGAITASKMSSNDCANGQVLQYDGTTWVCAASFKQSGSNIYYADGNIGIGTAIPTSKLQVVGTDNLSTSFAAKLGGATTTGLVVANSGNVGIGTTGPGYKLDVNGIMHGNSTLYINNEIAVIEGDTDSTSLWLNYRGYNGGATRYRDLKIGDGKNNSVLMVEGSSGNVGIGTTAPVSTLEVLSANQLSDGDGNLTVRSSDSVAIDKGGMITLGGSYGVTLNTTFAGIAGRKENSDTSGSGSIAGYLSFTSVALEPSQHLKNIIN